MALAMAAADFGRLAVAFTVMMSADGSCSTVSCSAIWAAVTPPPSFFAAFSSVSVLVTTDSWLVM